MALFTGLRRERRGGRGRGERREAHAFPVSGSPGGKGVGCSYCGCDLQGGHDGRAIDTSCPRRGFCFSTWFCGRAGAWRRECSRRCPSTRSSCRARRRPTRSATGSASSLRLRATPWWWGRPRPTSAASSSSARPTSSCATPPRATWGAPRRLLADGRRGLRPARRRRRGGGRRRGLPRRAAGAGRGGVLQQGAVYVFARDAGGADAWGQAAKLTDASVGSIGHFGASIALEGDLMAVGASRGGGGNGQVTILERGRGGPGDLGRGGLDPRRRRGRRRPAAGKLRRRGGAGGRPAPGRRAARRT